MTTAIRNLSDLHLLKDALQNNGERRNPDSHAETIGSVVGPTAALPELPENNPADVAELERLLKLYDLWLGYSPVKGWALLDRKHPEYSDRVRPFLLLGDGSLDRLSRMEFSREPDGPWKLNYWKLIDSKTRQEAGTSTALLPAIQRYIQEAEQAVRQKAKFVADQNEDNATRIGDPSFDLDFFLRGNDDLYAQWAAAKREHYKRSLPVRVEWLRRWAKKIHDGTPGLEPTWSRGIAAANHLSVNGIASLWHFTDIRNIKAISREGGLYSWAGLAALGIRDVNMVAGEFSRSCDARLGREKFVRLSFIPNSWFFQRVRWQQPTVWMRFSLKSLALGEVMYSLGNAASGFVSLQDNLQSMGINWSIVTPFSGECSDTRGPTWYPRLYENQVGDPLIFRQISNAWNSEVLIKHFLPIEFCDGIFDTQNGELVRL